MKTTIPSHDGGDIQAAVAQAMLEYAARHLIIARTESTTIRMPSRRPGRCCVAGAASMSAPHLQAGGDRSFEGAAGRVRESQ